MTGAPSLLVDAQGRPLTLARRTDRWENPNTGIGTDQFDKLKQGMFTAPRRVMDQEITSIMNESALGAKIVEKAPKESLRNGFELEADEDPREDGKSSGPKLKQSEIDDFRQWCTDELRLEEQYLEGKIYGRAYGGALLLLAVDDGALDVSEPLDFDRIKTFNAMNLVDRRYAYAQGYYSSTKDQGSKYGLPETYLVSNGVATYSTPTANVRRSQATLQKRPGFFVDVWHETRVIRFDGNRADVVTRQQLAGWTWSILQRVYDSLRTFDHDFDSVSYLLSDVGQGVIKIKGLLAGAAGNNRMQLAQRLQLLDEFRSVIRTVALDASSGEDFTRVPTPLGGVADILDRMMLRFAADVVYPATELFGQSAAGLNATGENDTRKWYSLLKTDQTTEDTPRLKRLFRFAAKAKNSPLKGRDVRWRIHWNPLWSPTDQEQADTRLKTAQMDTAYIDAGVVSAEVVALERQDQYKHLDVKSIEDSLKGATKFDPYENEPPPTTSAGIAQQQVGETQSPAVPLPLPGTTVKGTVTRSPPKARSTAPSGPARDSRFDSADIAHAVHAQLAEDYPEEHINWVKAGTWKGPVRVPVDKIDFSNKHKWQASADKVKVQLHGKRIADGIEKPIILAKTPHSKKLSVLDGHHRALAYLASGKAAKAYVVKVPVPHGPWEAMHAAQKETGLEASTQSQDK